MSDSDSLVEVYSPADCVQATLLTQSLENAGIECRVGNDQLRRVAGEVPFTKTAPQIWMRFRDLEDAAAICLEFDNKLKSRGRHDADEPAPPFCFHCGETVTAGTQTCPSCDGLLD